MQRPAPPTRPHLGLLHGPAEGDQQRHPHRLEHRLDVLDARSAVKCDLGVGLLALLEERLRPLQDLLRLLQERGLLVLAVRDYGQIHGLVGVVLEPQLVSGNVVKDVRENLFRQILVVVDSAVVLDEL